ncbi:MAG TPA: CBS domain-containing protein, partial [Kofleriaceae bacterium]|nr:CBS domain-containing protein [Kofleriaceae bacterium]
MHVRDIMRRSPLTVREDDGLGTAQALMAWNGIRHLPVVEQGRLSGILSERDLLAFRAIEPGWKAAHVRDAMTPRPQFAHPEDSLTEVAGRMAAARIGALPVVERGSLV